MFADHLTYAIEA